jgi:hypothetical protein
MGAAILVAATTSVIIHVRDRTAASSSPTVGVKNAFVLPSSPIAGIVISPAAQAEAYTGPIPALPAAVLKGSVCGQDGEPVSLLRSWVSMPDADGHSEQIAMNYSGGIWMAVSPMSFFAEKIQHSSELPRVEDFFTEEKVALETGEVRGHVAWVKERAKDFDCTAFTPVPKGMTRQEQERSGGNPDASVPPSPDPDGAVMYAPTLTADISWKENGSVIELAGPYPASFLSSLAEDLTWSS